MAGAFIEGLLARMTLAERIGQLNYPHAEGLDMTGAARGSDTRSLILQGALCGTSAGAGLTDRIALQRLAVDRGPHGIPLFFGKDCVQRHVTGGPIPLALACSWDLDLIAEIGRMTAREARADGITITWAPMVDISHDARWGRIAEQTVLRDRLGFGGLIVTDFTAIHPELVNHGIAADIRQAAYLAFKAGVTVDLVSAAFLTQLEQLVEDGARDPDAFRQDRGVYTRGPITEDEVTDRCRQVLAAKQALGLFDDPFLGMDPDRRDRVTYCRAHRDLVRRAAVASAVLLKNDGALPLAPGARVALVGPMADNRIDLQGTWAIDVRPDHSVTLREGLTAAGVQVLHAKGCNIVDDPSLAARLNMHNVDRPSVILGPDSAADMLAAAQAAVDGADVLVLALGEAKEHAGESSTRLDITLPGAQRDLVRALAPRARAQGKRVVLVVLAGRPLALTEEVALADAVIWTGHPGNEGGPALAQVLLGAAEPGGRLAQALPRHVGQMPLRSEDLPTGRPIQGAGVTVAGDDDRDAAGDPVFRKFTTACILEGPHTPLFPAGWGLGHTRFAHAAPRADRTRLRGPDDCARITVAVTNTGDRTGTEVVQLYLHDPVARISRPQRELKGWARLTLAPGETAEAVFTLTVDDLRYWHGPALEQMQRDWDPGLFHVLTGPNARDTRGITLEWLD
ncbi:MAG: glycoside hydrolase family 3 C-terminal domain-containing protein [Rhodobacterales bacterium]|nr:glycoside hydrolase family 3 C-terminal domain-containing protein [Rhodobacterales bacterium]